MCVVRVRVLRVNEVERDVFENKCCSKVELSCVRPGASHVIYPEANAVQKLLILQE